MLRAFAGLAGDLCSVPSTHVGQPQVPITAAPEGLTSSSGLCRLLYSCAHTPSHIFIVKMNLKRNEGIRVEGVYSGEQTNRNEKKM